MTIAPALDIYSHPLKEQKNYHVQYINSFQNLFPIILKQ